jgi:Ca2+/Na+ antiporter
MNKRFFDVAKPLIGLFTVVTIAAVAGKDWLAQYNIDWRVVSIGNFLLFDVGLAGLFIMIKTLKSSNPQAFVRAMYGSFIIKFFVLALAAFVYIMVTKKEVNKEGLIVCAALYIVYTFLEIRILTKLLKDKNA